FDGITYAKGAAVLKQLVAWVGENTFYEGARRYFDKHRFGATTLSDLLEALQAASRQELDSWKHAWLETSGPSTLSASWVTDPVGAITEFTLHQSGEACDAVLRPHRVTVSTWRAAGGTLERTHAFDVRIDGESTPIDPQGVLAIPGGAASVDLVVVNDDDLTYAISRLDERSTDVALTYVGTIEIPITRAVVWASLWNAVRDGLLDPRRFIVAVLGAVPAETEPAVRDRLLLFVSEALSAFLPGRHRTEVHDQVLATTARLARETTDQDAWRSYMRACIAEFAARGGEEFESTVAGLASSDNPDIAWRARRALAARGLTNEEAIVAWRDADGSGEAARMSVEALASLPEESARAKAWASVRSDTLSNDYLSATLAGLQSSSWEGNSGIDDALAHMRTYWESHTIGMSLRYVSGVLNLSVDIDRDGSVEASVGALHSWLDANEDAPTQLRRIVVEHLDDFQRRERVQRRWEHDQ
ncbi:MAG: ERAP1-like C-terminal domain-containing protein, partial [Actinomyces bouchesdurhonensis]|nr:ERAP1-like C-terminal domain-containing protein [Actinomyces bouchesdurhonensis]